MGSMKDTLGDTPYPQRPGWKEPTTSRDAALAVASTADHRRALVFDVIQAAGDYGATADEVAKRLALPVTSVRPRVTELNKAGRITEVPGVRRTNDNGMTAKVWRRAKQ